MNDLTPDRFETGRPMLLGGLRQRHEFATAGSGIAEQWRRFLSSEELPGRIGSELYGVMCGSDPTGFEYMCCVEAESLAALPEGTGRMRVPSQQYAVFIHHGGAATLQLTWLKILDWLAGGDYASAHLPDFEVYGPGIDPLTSAEGIEIRVGVVARNN